MNEISLLFVYHEKSIFLKFPKTTKIKDALTKFLKESNSINDLSPERITFLFKNKILNKEQNLEKSLLQIFKGYNNQIKVLDECNVIGGGPVTFCDVNKKITDSHKLTIPTKGSYRITEKGINIYGLCKGNNCIAKDKEVIVPIQKKFFDLVNEKYDLKCPKCSNIIIPKTVGFRDCEYQISGKKYENEKIEDFCFTEIADSPNEIKYYNPNDNGTALMIELKFEVLNYF